MTSTTRATSIGTGLVGALVFVEFVSGFLQGYYTPLASDIARHLSINDADVNWFEAAQLLLSALCVPALSKLGDLVGHQRVLWWSAVLTAVATWGVALSSSFETYLVFWALQGVFTVWLPLEVALIYRRSLGVADRASATRKATGVIVAALQAGAIAGALSAGAAASAFDPIWIVLAVPALLTTGVVVVIHVAVDRDHAVQEGSLDRRGLVLVSASLLLVTGGLSLVRTEGVGSVWPWFAMAAGLVLLLPFGRWELRVPDPLVDLRVMRRASMWPVQVTALLFGVSVLGAQIPLSTFAQTDPEVHGFGLGLDSSTVAPLIGVYVLSLLFGALVFARVSQRSSPRNCLIGAASLVATGYGALVLAHDTVPTVAACMIFPLIGVVADLRRTGRVHPAWGWGIAAMLGMALATEAITYSPLGDVIYRAVVAGSPGADVPPLAFAPPPGGPPITAPG